VNSKKPSLFVELDFKEMDAVFSDNYFSMDGGETRTITIEKSNHTLEHIKEQIQIRSLFSTY
jgi:beta-mannosidase